jgi:nucleotide-binding universal stress UspA family protein
MSKVLVPIDGSENATRAVRYAIDLAKRHPPVEIHLLTVHPEPVVYGEIQVYISREKMERLQHEHSMDLLRPAIDLAKAAGVTYESEVLVGDVAPTLVKRADELKCDAIVMGTRGMSAIGNLALGSIATKVIHLTNLPVTLIK